MPKYTVHVFNSLQNSLVKVVKNCFNVRIQYLYYIILKNELVFNNIIDYYKIFHNVF